MASSRRALRSQVIRFLVLVVIFLLMAGFAGGQSGSSGSSGPGSNNSGYGGSSNVPPSIGIGPCVHTIVEHQLFSLRIPGIDPDGDPISFALLAPAPPGSQLTLANVITPSQINADFEWQPGAGTVGSWSVTILLSDGWDVVSLTFTVNVLPAAEAAGLTATTPQGATAGQPWMLDITSPTAPGSPFVLFLGSGIEPGLPLTGIFGTGLLSLQPATMAILFNGLEPLPLNPFTTPFSVSGVIPGGLAGMTITFQSFVLIEGSFFASPPASIFFEN